MLEEELGRAFIGEMVDLSLQGQEPRRTPHPPDLQGVTASKALGVVLAKETSADDIPTLLFGP